MLGIKEEQLPEISNKFQLTINEIRQIELADLNQELFDKLFGEGAITSEKELKERIWDYIYEPDPRALLNDLLVRFIESQVYQGVVENNACEMAARMVAMKAATDNAGSIIKELQLIYNKARQAAITQEISEIVGGAAAV